MRDGKLTIARVEPEASLSRARVRMGVVPGSQSAEALLTEGVSTVWAKMPHDGGEPAGIGDSPEAALSDLAKRREPRRGRASK